MRSRSNRRGLEREPPLNATGRRSRRSFFRSVRDAAVVAGAAIVEHGADRADAKTDSHDPGLLIIDCHAHPYSEDTKKYPPAPKPYAPPRGTGTVAHLRRDSMHAGVRFVVGVQPRTYYLYDNRFVVDTGRSNRDWLTSVVNLDPDDPQSPELLERYVGDANVRGLVSVPSRRGRFQDDGVLRLWERAQRLGIVINVNTGWTAAEELDAMLRRFPKVRVALDHSLNLRAGPELEKLLAALSYLAGRPNLYTKLSFLPTGSAEKYPFRDLHEPCRRVVRAFGPDRCVWGSNFPCELWCPNVTYAQHLGLFNQELGLDRPTKEAILGKTARGLWLSG